MQFLVLGYDGKDKNALNRKNKLVTVTFLGYTWDGSCN